MARFPNGPFELDDMQEDPRERFNRYGRPPATEAIRARPRPAIGRLFRPLRRSQIQRLERRRLKSKAAHGVIRARRLRHHLGQRYLAAKLERALPGLERRNEFDLLLDRHRLLARAQLCEKRLQ